ncbi:LOW QUALITY PROTEIN: DNA-3-methyladenine glycosylase-like [Homarus americanus]|uniref:LOW QUALITY PROTEIN: DNA-3-methyladenine glycosylase-like n=1 Tax=Homarus americanus TaxID=6706 RepID=UPI001C44F8F3|nr:LOW QUALITY PROTEIN: DNA-3-methyladenine glycosylase-like [Homarus americanus]
MSKRFGKKLSEECAKKIKKLEENRSLRTHSLVKYENTCTAPGPSAPVSDVQAQGSGQDFTPGPRLSQDFYDQDSITLAKALLGQIVVRVVDGVRITGAVVETESYLGGPDVASHSHNGREARTEPVYMKPGTSYVYSIYGMYYCFNISSQGDGSCVLIRSLEPLEGFQKMGRSKPGRKNTTPLKIHDLCNGPSKICQALHLNKDSSNKVDLAESKFFWLEQGKSIPENQVIVTKRIGIDSCGEEWANKPLRFYVNGNKCVSVRDKKAENIF